VALAAKPQTGLVVVIVCVVGAICTVAAGCWQSAKEVAASAARGAGARAQAGQSAAGCGGTCATCTLSC